MKTLLKIVGVLVVCVVLLLVVLSITGLEPHDRRPGLWLKGNVVTTPVTDWSFTDKVPTVKLQTQSSFLLPHSVTINCVAYNGQLYLTSVYPAGTRRGWNDNVARNPQVRLKIADNVYDRTLVEVTDPVEKSGELEARAKKYKQLKPPADMTTAHVYRVVG